MAVLIMAICTVLVEKLYTVLRAQEARYNQFSFRMFKIMRSLSSSKCLKTAVELTFTI